jgi:hypothetical protein
MIHKRKPIPFTIDEIKEKLNKWEFNNS